jgi:ketosteroid isomerase-like protein
MKVENGLWTRESGAACPSFLRALNERDLGRACACFAREGCLITPDGTAVRGRERIRPLLAQLIALRTEIEVELSSVLSAGDLALASERWTIRCDGVEGSRFAQASNPTMVLRRLGTEWKLEIAALWGWGNERLDDGRPSVAR